LFKFFPAKIWELNQKAILI